MDNWLIFCGGMAGFLAISLPLVALTDWLQKKMDDWNKFNDEQQEQQQNKQEQ
jgi:hypothetical protein